MNTDAKAIWNTPAGGSLMAVMLGLKAPTMDDRETLARLIDDGGQAQAQDAGEWHEGDHPRSDSGQFGSGGGAPANRHAEGAAAIRAMDPDVRDETEFQNLPGGYQAHDLFEAQRLMPKASDKLKRVSERNSNTLSQSYHSIANVDGHLFGLTKTEDPDAEGDEEDANGDPKEFVWSFVRLDHPDDKGGQADSADVTDAFKAMRGYKAPAQVWTPAAAKK